MLKIEGSKLVEMIDAVAWAMSCDEDRPHLACVHVEVVKDRLRLVATNGHVLAVATNRPPVVDGESKAPATRGAFDQRELARIRYMATRATSPLEIKLTVHDHTNELIGASTLTIGRRDFDRSEPQVVVNALPPWRQVVPASVTPATRIVVETPQLLDTLHAFKCACSTHTNMLRLDVKGDELQFTAQNYAGDAFDAISVIGLTGPLCKIGVDRSYLYNAFAASWIRSSCDPTCKGTTAIASAS